MIYSENVKYSIIRIFGLDSEIYKALINGEKVSLLIKKSYCRKGFGVTRIREKKQLFEMCKEQEYAFEQKDILVDVNI